MRDRVGTALDLANEARSALAMSPGRTAASVIGIVLAVAGFVAAYGLSLTLAGQVSDTFNAIRATEVIANVEKEWVRQSPVAPYDACRGLALTDVRLLSGVQNAGLMQITSSELSPVLNAQAGGTRSPVIGVDTDALQAIQPHLVEGRLFDHGAVQRGDSVALVPASQAKRLGVGGVGDSLTVAGRRFWVLGLFDDVGRRPEALNAVLLPGTTLATLPQLPDKVNCRVVIETVSGAAGQVAAQTKTALDPGRQIHLSVASPPDPIKFRRSLEGPVQQLSLVLSAVMLLLGVLSIAFAANSSVSARTAEFGLRQSLGATPGVIGAQVILENLLLGLLGGVIGAYLGSATVLGVSLANGWAPVLDLIPTIAAVGACGIFGALAAVIPAIRAARLNPVDALRA